MIISFLLDILYMVVSRIILIIGGIAGVISAKITKKPWRWFAAGAVIDGISVLGTIAGMVRNPDVWANYSNILSVATYFALLLIFYILIRKASNS